MKEKSIVAKVFVINGDGLILALLRSKNDKHRPAAWDLPGGGVEFGEDPTHAAMREAKEEAGIKLQKAQVFITKTSVRGKYIVRLLYYAHVDNPDVTLSHEHDEYKWVSREDFIELDIPEYYKDCLRELPLK
jgi:8-oxo-dGTP diphosphatase